MKIQGKAMWASVQAPNTKFDPTWQIDLIIEDKQVAGAKKASLKVKKTEYGNTITFKRRVTRKDGGANSKPVVVDAHNEPMTALVGNGSLVNVQFSTFEYNNSFGSGVGADLQGVQVLELVEYGEPDGGEFDSVGEDNDQVDEVPEVKPDFDDDLPDVL